MNRSDATSGHHDGWRSDGDGSPVRYYGAGLGRLTTVDPALNIKDALVDPQRWNRYAYTVTGESTEEVRLVRK